MSSGLQGTFTGAAFGRRPSHVQTDLDVTDAVEARRSRLSRALLAAERRYAALLGGAFVAAAATLALAAPSERSPSAVAALLLVVSYAFAYRLEFEVGNGSGVPTQLVLVPMLFALPAGYVPLAVGAGLTLANFVDHVRGEIPLGRVFLRLVNGWHALGPALVFVLAGEAAPELALWPIYVAALAAQFAFDFLSSAGLEWVGHRADPRSHFRAMLGVWRVDALLAPVALAFVLAAGESPYAVALALPLVGLLAVFAHERKARLDNALELSSAYRGTALLLGDVVEADDAYTGSHSRDVVSLSIQVAEELGLRLRERRDTEFVALLHDVGKIRVPSEIINKPGPLDDAERAIMAMHTIDGERMLSGVGGVLADVGRIVRSCHERYDGAGYPDGIAGEDIPLVARIVCCCDAFSAMTTDRPYRKALPLGAALEELVQNAGSQFDPDVVDALVRVVTRPS